jgi:hypothetical protein
LASGYKLIDIPISTRLIILFFFATGALGALEMLSKETIKLFNIISFLEIIIKKSMPKVILKLSYYIIFSATMVCFFILFYIIPEISKQNTNELAFLASNPRIVFILTSPERLLLIIPILVYFYARLYSIAFKGQIKKPIFLFLMTDWLSWICLIMVALIYLASGTRFY